MATYIPDKGTIPSGSERIAPSAEPIRSARASRFSKAERRLAMIVATLGFVLLIGLTARHPISSPTVQTATTVTAAESAGLGGSQVTAATPARIPEATAPYAPSPAAGDPSPSTLPGSTRAGGDGFSLDPKQWVIDALGAAFSWMVSGINSALTDLLRQALDLDILVQTPPGDTYQNGVVLAFWRTLVAVADAALALIVCWAGYNSIIAYGTGGRYHEARQVIPRVALAALGINLSLLVAQTLIDLNNALCSVVSDPFAKILSLLALNGANGASGVAFFVLFLTFGVVGLLLVVQMVVRLAMLDVLIVTAPLGLVCWALPQTHAWAQLWTRAFVSTVFVQFLQVLALTLGGGLIAFFPSAGLFAALMDLMVGLATLYLTLKIPSFLRSFGGPAAPNPLSDAAGVAGTALLVARLAAFAAA